MMITVMDDGILMTIDGVDDGGADDDLTITAMMWIHMVVLMTITAMMWMIVLMTIPAMMWMMVVLLIVISMMVIHIDRRYR